MGYFDQCCSSIDRWSVLSRDEAREMCEAVGLLLDETDIEYRLTENLENGRIISVEPEIGTTVDKGSELSIVVSSGIGVRIEDFATSGMNISKAQEYISQHYPLLKVTIVEEDSNITPGMIIRQEGLEPYTLFNPEGAGSITLVYSSYPTISIPEDIIGKPINDVKGQLELMGITVRVSNRDISGLTQNEIDALQFGVVIEADPTVGSSYTQREDNYVVLYYY